jgi:hypothetical protein
MRSDKFSSQAVLSILRGGICTRGDVHQGMQRIFFFRKKKKKRNKTLACDVINLDRVRVFVGYFRLDFGKLLFD